MKTRILGIAAALAIGSPGLCHAGYYFGDFFSGVGAASLRGDAALDSASVRLTSNLTSQEGSLVIDNLDPGEVVQAFDAAFALAIGPNGVPPADGVSFSFGPPPAGTYGENGATTGLAVSFDLYANIGEVPTSPAIRVYVNGTQVAAQQVTLTSGGAFRPVSIHYDADGLDLNYNSGEVVLTNQPLPGFNPSTSYQFTFGARTGDSTAEQRIDTVEIETQAVAVTDTATVPTLSEWGMIGLGLLLAGLGGYALRRPGALGGGSGRRGA